MLDHYLSLMYQQEKTAALRSEMVEQMKKLPEAELHKIASGHLKLADICGESTWLDKFKGSDLYESALQLEQELLELDIQRLQAEEGRAAERLEHQQHFQAEDQVRLKKRVLELQLNQQELQAMGGGGDPLGGMEAPAPPVPPAPPGPPVDPNAVAPPAPPKPSVTQTTEEKMKVGHAIALLEAALEKNAEPLNAARAFMKEKGVKRVGQLLTGSRKEHLEDALMSGKTYRSSGPGWSHTTARANSPTRSSIDKNMFKHELGAEGRKVTGTRAAAGGAAVGAGVGVHHAMKDKEKTATALAIMKMAMAKEALLDTALAGLMAHSKAQNAGYNEPGQAALRGAGGWLGGGALGATLGSAVSQGHPYGALAGGLGGAYGGYKLLTSKYDDEKPEKKPKAKEKEKTASEIAKEAFMGAAMMGLRGAGSFLRKAAPLAVNAAQHGGARGLGGAIKSIGAQGLGQAGQWAAKNPLAAGALGAGALGTAALGGAAVS